MKNVVIGKTSFSFNKGSIASISRGVSIINRGDPDFQEALNTAFSRAVTNHSDKMLSLIAELEPANDIYTFNALSSLQDCLVPNNILSTITVVRIGKTFLLLEKGIISSIRREDSIITKEDSNFQSILNIAFLTASNHHTGKMLELIPKLNLEKDIHARKALVALLDCYIPIKILNAITSQLDNLSDIKCQ